MKTKESIEEFKYRIDRYNFLHGLIQKEDEVKKVSDPTKRKKKSK